MKKQFSVVCNWKMYFPLNTSIEWIIKHFSELIDLQSKTNQLLIICPSFDALYPIAQHIKNSPIRLGAQNCSTHDSGAYTGEVSAKSLAQIGCNFCIIGHSERRQYFKETNEEITQKISRLFSQAITPILCIGETKNEYENKATQQVLDQQLSKIPLILKENDQSLYIAYEPIWAIGTGKIANISYLTTIFDYLQQKISQYPNKKNIRLLYGGSIKGESTSSLLKISNLNGFLIGNASTDFQELKKIVLSIV
ncbi:MAG: triose-phosphate isomerase [Candidatus Babeliales bacterium]